MKKHFTLIELLVVISIIAVLAGMLLPALSAVKDKVESMTCMNQQKQVFTYANMYTNDYDYLILGHGDEQKWTKRNLWGLYTDYKMPKNIADCPAYRKQKDALLFQTVTERNYFQFHSKKEGYNANRILSSVCPCPNGYQLGERCSHGRKVAGTAKGNAVYGGTKASGIFRPSFKIFIHDDDGYYGVASLHERKTVFVGIYADGHGAAVATGRVPASDPVFFGNETTSEMGGAGRLWPGKTR